MECRVGASAFILLSVSDIVRCGMYAHEGGVPIGRECDAVAANEAVCHHPHGARAGVEAVDLVRQQREWAEVVQEAIPEILSRFDAAPLIRNQRWLARTSNR